MNKSIFFSLKKLCNEKNVIIIVDSNYFICDKSLDKNSSHLNKSIFFFTLLGYEKKGIILLLTVIISMWGGLGVVDNI